MIELMIFDRYIYWFIDHFPSERGLASCPLMLTECKNMCPDVLTGAEQGNQIIFWTLS